MQAVSGMRFFGGWQKGGFPKGWFRVHSDVPPERKQERRYVRMFPRKKPERGHICQNHPFTKPPFYLPVSFGGVKKERRRRRAEKWLSKRVLFERVRFFSAPLRFALKNPENVKGAEKKRTLQKHPFGQPFLCTTPSLLLWRALRFAPLAR